MKRERRRNAGFTLVELMVVISIIAVLAALILSVLHRVKVKALLKKAEIEEASIVQAIHSYDHDYGKLPASAAAINAASAVPLAAGGPDDITYGTAGVTCVGPGGPNAANQGFSAPTGYQAVGSPGYQTNNSEIMAVLLDMEHWPNTPGVPTVNLGHALNPQRTKYLNAHMSGDNSSPGIGQDGVFRDPWGNPYIITLDLNYDGKARDAFYRDPAVSQDQSDPNPPPKRGLNGLIPRTIGTHTFYEANDSVMVWSAGPDKLVEPNPPPNQGVNRDNVLSWK
ncbi:MAG TPA: type II secretion system protein [Candidatus Acidoferrum sp.]|nr:type II secretion system protein [Candidatus Acidoferrum sp.]